MKKFLMIFIVLGASLAYAAHGGEAETGDVEVPKVVLYQAINVIALFVGLIYILRGKVISFYASRKTNFVAAAEKSKAAQDQAQHELLEIKHRLQQLGDSAEENYMRAKAESVNMRDQMVRGAHELASRLKHEAEQTAKIEIQKAQIHLRDQLLKDSVAAAKIVLSKDIGSNEHQKLQSDFVNKVQAVSP